jgi:hypothetical protein
LLAVLSVKTTPVKCTQVYGCVIEVAVLKSNVGEPAFSPFAVGKVTIAKSRKVSLSERAIYYLGFREFGLVDGRS